MATRTEHRVTFYSPGTFFTEDTSKPIPEWNTATAARMAQDIVERYNAKPFGFRFSTLIVSDPIPDDQGGMLNVEPKQTKRSGLYYLGGTIRSYHDVQAANDLDEKILLSNMRWNAGHEYVVTNCNSWQFTGGFGEHDFVVDPKNGDIIERGDRPDRIEYRKKMRAEHEADKWS